MNRFILKFLFLVLLVSLYWLSQPPFKITHDMALVDEYQKSFNLNPKDDFFTSFTRYNAEGKKSIDSIADNNLLAIRCGDNILRTNQGAYILKNIKTSKHYRRRIQNTDFISFMRNKEYSLPSGKKILTARICEAQNKTILLFYSIGTYENRNVDNNTILQTIHDSTDNEAYLQIIPSEIFSNIKKYKLAESNSHVVCDEPFQLTKNNILYLLCNEEFSNISSYFIEEININTGEIKIVNKCSNQHGVEIKTVCN